jgi:4-amino-4-deoxy-L-arabinose transferase-like glycosyltransferase
MIYKGHPKQTPECCGLGQSSAKNKAKHPFWRRPIVILLLILLVGGILRLAKPGKSPPGFNQDEAVHAWNAWCLLKTGKDQVGVRWPIFYIHALGDNRTTLYIYTMIPFLAVGGLSFWTARLVSVVEGVLCIPLIYIVASRLFDRRVGLAAALLLALNPWHIHISRWAVEPILCPLVSLLTLAMMLWAKMPLKNENADSPDPLRAMLAGAAAGVGCYGYPAIRIFTPLFLAMIVLVTLPAWLRSLKTRNGILAIGAFIIAFAVFFVPLVWEHIFHAEDIAMRAVLAWNQTDPLTVKIHTFLSYYINHFSLDFLFIRGDLYETQSLPGVGEFHWYELPLILAGAIILISRFRTSYSARIVLAFVFIYPVSDSFTKAISSHSFRSAPGLCSLILLSAVGAVVAGEWLWKRNKKIFSTALAIFIFAAAGLNTRYLNHYFGEYNVRPAVYQRFFVDFVEACQWLRPRFDKYDAIFCTTEGLNMPYIVTLVALGYDPNRWLNEPREFTAIDGFDYYARYGKMYFMYGQPIEPILKTLPANPRVLVIVRPGGLNLQNPVYQIYDPDGSPILWLCEP